MLIETKTLAEAWEKSIKEIITRYKQSEELVPTERGDLALEANKTWCQSLNCELMFDKEQGDAQKTGTCGTFLSNSITAQFRRELWQCC